MRHQLKICSKIRTEVNFTTKIWVSTSAEKQTWFCIRREIIRQLLFLSFRDYSHLDLKNQSKSNIYQLNIMYQVYVIAKNYAYFEKVL